MDTFLRDQQQQQQQQSRAQSLPRQVPDSPEDQGGAQARQQDSDVYWVLGGASTVLGASHLQAGGQPSGLRLGSSGVLDTVPIASDSTGAERNLRSGGVSGDSGGASNKFEQRLPDVALTVAAGATEEGPGPRGGPGAEAGQAGHRGSVDGRRVMMRAGKCCSARRRRCGEAALQSVQVGRGRPGAAAHAPAAGGGRLRTGAARLRSQDRT